MATLRQIVDSILTQYSGGRRSNDDVPERNWIIFKLLQYRAMYIRRDLEKNMFISEQFQQDLGCIDLELSDAAECCTTQANCTVLRTVSTIPVPVRLKNKDAFIYIGDIDKVSSYKIIKPQLSKWTKYNKYTSGDTRAYYLNNRIYIVTDNQLLSHINVRGIFYDPRDTRAFTCDNEPCYTEDSHFPIGDDMLQSITIEILKELSIGATDTTNDLRDDKTGEDRKN